MTQLTGVNTNRIGSGLDAELKEPNFIRLLFTF